MFLNYRDSYLAISWQKYATISYGLLKLDFVAFKMNSIDILLTRTS